MPQQIFSYEYFIASIMKKMNNKHANIVGRILWYRYNFLLPYIFSSFHAIHYNSYLHPWLPYIRYGKTTSLTATAIPRRQKANLNRRTVSKLYFIASNAIFGMIIGSHIYTNFHQLLTACNV